MAEPLTLAEAKSHLRKTTDEENELIASFIVAARQWVENYTGSALVPADVIDVFYHWGPCLVLRRQPIAPDPVPAITYTNAEGAPTAYLDGVLRSGVYPWTIWPPTGASFPELGPQGTIEVAYRAGYAVPDDVPTPLKQAMLLLIGEWYSTRSAAQSESFNEPPFAVASLCRPYRQPVLA